MKITKESEESYARGLHIANRIYDVFDEEGATLAEGMTVLVMALLSISEEAGISTETLITGIRTQQELQNIIRHPHGTIQ